MHETRSISSYGYEAEDLDTYIQYRPGPIICSFNAKCSTLCITVTVLEQKRVLY